MELLRNWICGICAVSVLIAIAQALTPKNAVAGSIRMIGALILIMVMLAPVAKINLRDFRITNRQMMAEAERKTKKIDAENQKIKESIIEDSLATYICKRAKQIGADVDATVTCVDEVPQYVTVFTSSSAHKKRVVRLIEEECGILPENITVRTMQEEG